jgi:membrane associated rhomboid family serine protease
MFKHFKNLNNNKIFQEKLKQHKLTNNFSKRNFFNMPGFNFSSTTKYLAIGFSGMYLIKLFMDDRSYIQEFFYHKYALQYKKFHTLITSHFVSTNLFDYIMNIVIIGLIGSNIEMMFGSVVYSKLIVSSMALGSLFLILFHKDNSFIKSDAILRGMMMYLVLSNPNTSFMLFPFPFQIRAKILGALLVLIDILTKKYVNFGGTFAAAAITTGFI